MQSSNNVEKIKERLSIVDVTSSYIKLEKAGINYKARCPFHNEKTPSFFISPDRNSYYCFGCGVKGDIFSFVEAFEGVDFRGALKILADRAGVELVFEKKENEDSKTKLFDIMEKATFEFEKALQANKDANEYLKKRGLTEATIKKWRVGYAPLEWHFSEEKISNDKKSLEEAGLIKKGEKGYYDRFRGRIMFPIFDTSGRVVAFSGRILDPKGDEAKYLNSPETALFSKSNILYGLDRAKLSIREKDYVVLVEGQLDLLMCHQAGVTNAIATSGTALTESHLKIIKRFSGRMMLAYDSDSAGWRASRRAWELALGLGMDIKVAEMPKGEDPADLILKDKSLFLESLKKSKHIIDLAYEKVAEKKADRRVFVRELRAEVLPYIKMIESDTEKSELIKMISDRGDISEEDIRSDLAKIIIEDKFVKEDDPKEKEKREKTTMITRRIFGVLFSQKIKEQIKKFDKFEEDVKKILDKEFSSFEKEMQAVKHDLIFEAEEYYQDPKMIEKDLDELLINLEKEMLEKQALNIAKQIVIEEKAGNTEKAEGLAQELSNVLRKKHKLKN